MPCPSWRAPGVENRKLIVSRNVTTAPKLPTNDALGENGRAVIRRAVAISIKPITFRDSLNAQYSVHPRHERTMQNQGLNSGGFRGSDFQQSDSINTTTN